MVSFPFSSVSAEGELNSTSERKGPLTFAVVAALGHTLGVLLGRDPGQLLGLVDWGRTKQGRGLWHGQHAVFSWDHTHHARAQGEEEGEGCCHGDTESG